jgi:ketosteroid isomerase-like protein
VALFGRIGCERRQERRGWRPPLARALAPPPTPFAHRRTSLGDLLPRDTAQAMSQETVELARRGFEAFNRTFAEGTPDLFETLDPEVEWVPMSALLEGTSYQGHHEVRQWFEEMKRDWTTYEIKPERFLDLGDDRVLTLGRWLARGRGGDVLLDIPQAAWLLQYRGEKLIRLQTFTDRKKALETAGLRE